MSSPPREATLFFQKDFPASELTGRRRSVMAAMRGGVSLLAGATEVPGFDPFRQNNDFYYLTGIEVPHAYLTMDAAKGRCVLYLPPRDEKHEASDGPSLCADDAEFVRSRTGIDEVRPVARLPEDLTGLRHVWLMRSPDEGSRQCQDTLRRYQQAIATDPLDGRPCRGRWLRSRVAQLSPAAEFHDLSPIVHAMRLVKSAGEIELMRQSGRLTALACMEAMRSTRPGVYEFQLGAAADYLFQANGAQGAGYRPIIASGSNIPMMHYWRNNAPLRSGDLVLYDYAPDYNYYTSDIGRMWPVDGTYSPPQRELYGFVLEHHRVLLSLVRPGRTKDEILDEAAEQLRPIVEGRNWSKPHYKSAALRLLESKRPLSHGVGMAVHEAAAWDGRPVEPGLVFAVDPELLVPEERLYVRVEDTVRVTEDGAENLTASCPREMDDVERLMKEPGMLQCHPAIYENAGR